MGTYYVRKTGNDGNAGTSPGAAWLTLTKALQATYSGSEAVVVYVGAGTYREQPLISATGFASIVLNADPFGIQTGDAGEIIWTGFLTNDTSAPGANATVRLNGQSNITIQGGFTIYGGSSGNGSCVDGQTTQGSAGITIKTCALIASTGPAIGFKATVDAAANWLIDSCAVEGVTSHSISITLVSPSGASDVDVNFTVRNSRLVTGGGGGDAIRIVPPASLTSTGAPWGVRSYKNTFRGGSQGVNITGANHSIVNPSLCYNCILVGHATGLKATTTGQLVEDYNYIGAQTPRVNVASGANSVLISAYAPTFEFGQSMYRRGRPRPYMEPAAGSAFLGFGQFADSVTLDARGFTRPYGGQSAAAAAGWLERLDTGILDTANADAGSTDLKQAGPCINEFYVPVSAASTTISIKQKTSSYVGTTFPKIELVANGEIGVSGQTVSDSSAHTSYTTLTLSPFTPTAAGIVIIRLYNLTGDGAGIVYWDTAGVPMLDTSGFGYWRIGEPCDVLIAQGGGLTPNYGIRTGGRI